MHRNEIFYVLICINNHLLSFIINMLSITLIEKELSAVLFQRLTRFPIRPREVVDRRCLKSVLNEKMEDSPPRQEKRVINHCLMKLELAFIRHVTARRHRLKKLKDRLIRRFRWGVAGTSWNVLQEFPPSFPKNRLMRLSRRLLKEKGEGGNKLSITQQPPHYAVQGSTSTYT